MIHLADGIEFMKALPDQSVDGIFSDPPWGTTQRRAFEPLMNSDRWEELLTEMTAEASRVLKPTGVCLLWFGLIHMERAIKATKDLKYLWTFFCMYTPPRYIACMESSVDPILVYVRKDGTWPKTKNRIRALYQKASVGAKDTLHPCARPFETVKHILFDFFEPGQYIIDPFAGSDTTGRASRDLGLKWDSCELDPEKFEFAKSRHAQHDLFSNNDAINE